jgi:hypothetical protein
VPSGAVEDQHTVCDQSLGRGKASEERSHGRGQDGGQYQPDSIGGLVDGADDVDWLVRLAPQTARTITAAQPVMASAALLVLSGFVHQPTSDGLTLIPNRFVYHWFVLAHNSSMRPQSTRSDRRLFHDTWRNDSSAG